MFTTVKSSKRTIITSLSILSLAVSLGACGGGSNTPDTTTSTPDGGGEETAATLDPPLEGNVALTISPLGVVPG